MAVGSPVRMSVAEVPAQGRVIRRPAHTFQIRSRPFAIQPFMIAPVLPGETLRNLLLQSRVVSDPVKNPLVGWWKEYYFFYVKHRDLDGRDILTAMMLDTTTDVSTLEASANALHYYNGDGIDWVSHCLKRVVEEYFRDEGEAWNNVLIGTMPAAKINSVDWTDSIIEAQDVPDTTLVNEGGAGTLTSNELDVAMRTWEYMRSVGLTNMDYEQYLATYGVRVARVEPHKPELIRYLRHWSYPSNTVDPATGAPSSALSWSIAERADKDRFFTEPGFIFGVTVTRPKVYKRRVTSAGVNMLNNAMTWLPAVMRNEPYTSLIEFAAGAGPIPGSTNAYRVDVRDLFVHGDQFINFDVSADLTASAVDLPLAAISDAAKKYPDEDDSEDLFIDDDDSPGNTRVREDGIVTLQIAGTQVDHT